MITCVVRWQDSRSWTVQWNCTSIVPFSSKSVQTDPCNRSTSLFCNLNLVSWMFGENNEVNWSRERVSIGSRLDWRSQKKKCVKVWPLLLWIPTLRVRVQQVGRVHHWQHQPAISILLLQSTKLGIMIKIIRISDLILTGSWFCHWFFLLGESFSYRGSQKSSLRFEHHAKNELSPSLLGKSARRSMSVVLTCCSCRMLCPRLRHFWILYELLTSAAPLKRTINWGHHEKYRFF